jgi:hypothetical protein
MAKKRLPGQVTSKELPEFLEGISPAARAQIKEQLKPVETEKAEQIKPVEKDQIKPVTKEATETKSVKTLSAEEKSELANKKKASEKPVEVEDDKVVAELKKIEGTFKKGLLLKTGDGINSNLLKLSKELKSKLTGKSNREQLDESEVRKKYATPLGETIRNKITGIKEGTKDFFTKRGFLDKIGIAKRGGTGFLSQRLDANEAAEKNADALIAAGVIKPKDREKQIGKEKRRQAVDRNVAKLNEKIQDKYSNLTEAQIKKTPEGKELAKQARELQELDTTQGGKPVGTKGKKTAAGGKATFKGVAEDGKADIGMQQAHEKDEKFEEQNEEQIRLLKEISENTSAKTGKKVAKDSAKEDTRGTGIMAKIGEGLKDLGTGIKGLGTGIGGAIEGILKGIAKGIAAFGNGNVLKGAAALLVVGGAMWVASKAFQNFADLDWGSIAKGFVALLGLAAVATVLSFATPFLIEGAIGIAAIGASLIPFAIAMRIAGPAFSQFGDMMEKLGNVDAMNIAALGPALISLAAGMVAFSAANVVAGIGNLVGGILGAVTGQKTPIEQLEDLSQYGPGLKQAGDGVKEVGDGLKSLSDIDPETLKLIAALPVDKIEAMGKAMGKAKAEELKQRSAANEDMKAANDGGKESKTLVNAPTTVTNVSQNQFNRKPARSSDWFQSRTYKTAIAGDW